MQTGTWTSIGEAAREAAEAARSAELALRRETHPERDPFEMGWREFCAGERMRARREAFRAAHRRSVALSDAAATG